MRRRSPALILTVLVVLLAVFLALWGASDEKRIAVADLNDRIAGGWAGQMIGVSYGAPTEFRAKRVLLDERDIPAWKPGRVGNSLGQDDLYVDMTFAKVLDDKGLDTTTEDFGAMFRDAKYALWHTEFDTFCGS